MLKVEVQVLQVPVLEDLSAKHDPHAPLHAGQPANGHDQNVLQPRFADGLDALQHGTVAAVLGVGHDHHRGQQVSILHNCARQHNGGERDSEHSNNNNNRELIRVLSESQSALQLKEEHTMHKYL